MASSSRPFESQTLSRLMARYRNLHHGASTLLRKGRLALLWGVQVMAFPAYVAFQSIRMGYRRLQGKHPWQGLKRLLSEQPSQQVPLTSDTPIRALLSAIQPQLAPPGGKLSPINYHGAFLRQAHAGGILTKGGWHLMPVQESIRGIASDLATRQLVLVTTGNGIFDGLTEEQQGRLTRAISLLLAEYAAQHNRGHLDYILQQPGLPLPKAEPNQWLIVRWLHWGMRWMQTSGLAATTNLFGEAQQRHTSQTFRNSQWQHFSTAAMRPTELAAQPPDWMHPKTFVPSDLAAAAILHTPSHTSILAEQRTEARFEKQQTQDIGYTNNQRQPHGVFLPTAGRGTELSWSAEIETIETQVAKATYVDCWFVQLLRGVDTVLLWLEQTAQQLWQSLRQWLS